MMNEDDKMNSYAIYSDKIVLENEVFDGYIIVENDKILQIQQEKPSPDLPIKDHSGLVVMAGLVDSHVHINEPGRTEWEGFYTATQAALAGGITTVIDMPLNCDPVTTTKDALDIKRASLGEQLHVDIGFWGGVIPSNVDMKNQDSSVTEENLSDLSVLIEEGVLGCKAFMVHSGIDDFPESDEKTLRKGMNILQSKGLPLLVHAELDCGADIQCHDQTSYEYFLQSRPSSWEVNAILKLIELCRETRCHVHIVHLSASEALPYIEAAKKEGLPLTVETCPHYLCLQAEEIQNKETHFKCAPPIRDNHNRNQLWKGLCDGIIDFIVSDHSPCIPQLKKLDTGNFMDAWGGISSLQLGLSSVWTTGADYGISLSDVARWLSWRPSVFAGLQGKKGKISLGYDADFVVWDPNEQFVLEPQDLRFRHKLSPYLGKHLKGRVHYTYLRGQLVYNNGTIVGSPKGRPILFRRQE